MNSNGWWDVGVLAFGVGWVAVCFLVWPPPVSDALAGASVIASPLLIWQRDRFRLGLSKGGWYLALAAIGAGWIAAACYLFWPRPLPVGTAVFGVIVFGVPIWQWKRINSLLSKLRVARLTALVGLAVLLAAIPTLVSLYPYEWTDKEKLQDLRIAVGEIWLFLALAGFARTVAQDMRAVDEAKIDRSRRRAEALVRNAMARIAVALQGTKVRADWSLYLRREMGLTMVMPLDLDGDGSVLEGNYLASRAEKEGTAVEGVRSLGTLTEADQDISPRAVKGAAAPITFNERTIGIVAAYSKSEQTDLAALRDVVEDAALRLQVTLIRIND